MRWTIREERSGDESAIRAVTEAAFATAPYADGHEGVIPERLREAGALAISLVAVSGEEVIGHIAFSPVALSGQSGPWFGLGPIAVHPDRQGNGVGSALVREGLDRLRDRGATGCVLIGDPGYYGRFGFRAYPNLRYGDVPSGYVQALVLDGTEVFGTITFHPAFDVKG